MKRELQTFIDDIDFAGNFADGAEPLKFEYMVLRAVTELFGTGRPLNDVLAEIYSELQRVEEGGNNA